MWSFSTPHGTDGLFSRLSRVLVPMQGAKTYLRRGSGMHDVQESHFIRCHLAIQVVPPGPTSGNHPNHDNHHRSVLFQVNRMKLTLATMQPDKVPAVTGPSPHVFKPLKLLKAHARGITHKAQSCKSTTRVQHSAVRVHGITPSHGPASC